MFLNFSTLCMKGLNVTGNELCGTRPWRLWTPGACSVRFMYSRQYPLHKIPNFHLISWCGNFVDRHSFSRVSGNSPKLYGNCAFPQSFRTREFRDFTPSPEIFIRFSRKFAFYQSHWFHAVFPERKFPPTDLFPNKNVIDMNY